MKIYRNGVETYDLNINHETVVTNRMMVENTVVLQYSSTTPLENLKIGDYFTIDDERYELNELPEVHISDQMVYSYTALFVGHLHTLDNFLIDRENFNEKFFYFGNAQGHLDFILEKINKVADGYSYTFDEKGVSVEPHNMDYGSMSVLSAMHKFCEVFGCEFDLQGKTFRIAKKLEQPTDSIFQVGKGKGLYSIVRGKLSNEKITTVLYALGGKTNMMNDERLSLDGEKIESNVALYGIREEKVVFENIYPRCNQAITSDAKRISENSAYWSVEVANMNFDLGKCILEDPLIEFTTGNCMGVQFKIIRYDDASKTIVFEEKSEEMNDGMTSALPNDTRKPMSSDTLHFLNILLPDRYVVEAKQELRKAAEAELAKRSVPQAPYTVEIDSRFLVNKTRPRNGDLVRIVHEEIGLDALIRIIGMTYPLTEPDNMRLTISDNILVSGSQSLLQTIRKDIQTAVASGVRYHPLMGNFSTPLAASEVVSKLIKNKDFDGFGFEKKGFAIGTHPTLPDQTIAEVDYLNVRKRLNVYELTINQIKHMGGKMIYSAASMEISKVEELENGEQKVYFDSQKGQLKNLFTVEDLALCQHFDTNSKTPSKQYHWAVTAVGEDFIVLLPNLTYSGIAEVGDIVIQYGNTKDPERQHAYTIDVIGGARTSFVSGLDRIGATGTIVSELGFIDGKPQFSVGDQDSYIRYNAMDKLLEVSGKATFQGGSSGLANLEEWNEAAQDIQAAQAAADEAKGMINGLPYVGRNLVRNSTFRSGLAFDQPNVFPKHWAGWNRTALNNNHYGDRFVCFTHDNSSTNASLEQALPLVRNTKYAFSFVCHISGTLQFQPMLRYVGYDYAERYQSIYPGQVGQGDTPIVIDGHFTTEDYDYKEVALLFVTDIRTQGDNRLLFLSPVKLERGDRSTEWSPAYEDTEEGIANAKQAGETAQNIANGAQSAISAMNDDTVFDMVEKQTIRTQWEKISGVASTSSNHGTNGSYFKALTEISKIESLNSHRTSLTVAYNSLRSYLNTNELYNSGNKKNFNRAQMAAFFTLYGNMEVACYNAIQEFYSSVAQQTANAANKELLKLEFLKEAYSEETTIQGGVVQNSVTLLKDKEGRITCLINGDPNRFDAVAFAAGIAGFLTPGETRNLQIFHNGRLVARDADIEGRVNATSGSFTGHINASSGLIGGFEIAPGRIGVENSDGRQGLSILNSFIKFSDEQSWAGIGTNVFPSTSGWKGLARFDINELSQWEPAAALSANIPASIDYSSVVRRAYNGNGNFWSMGGHCLFDTTYQGAAWSNTIMDNVHHTHRFVFTSIPSAHQIVTLPGHDIINRIVSNKSVSFTLEIQIAVHIPNKIRIVGTSTGWLVGNTGVPVNGDFGWIDMYHSNSIILKYYASHYFMHKYP